MNEEKKRFRGSPNAPQKARIEDRAAQILRLRREGKSVRDISEELGVARTTVHDALVSAMRALRAATSSSGPSRRCCPCA